MIASMVAAAVLVATNVVEDPSVRFEVPEGWTASGSGGEYWMESGPETASLLLLPPDPERSLDVILADIEAQFLSTGTIEAVDSDTRRVRGETVFERRYRLLLAGSERGDDAILMHQYSFVRSAVHVLLQVESPPRHAHAETLFRTVHASLEIRRAPDPFGEAIDPFAPADSLAPEDSSGSDG